MNMVTQEDVIKRFKNLHGDTYDYSLVHYTKMEEKIKIICSKHGVFEQTPHSHLKGQGCPKCGIERRTNAKRYNTKTFIQKAKEVHGDKYDYSKVEYVDSYKKVCIICPIHGEFWQGPSDHLNGKGCRKCSQEKNSRKRRLMQEEFIERSNKAHNNKYDYSKTVYKTSTDKVCIICPIHGEFWQRPYDHISGHGCQKCAIEYNANNHRKDTEQFIREAKAVHGDKYDYSKTVYKSIYEKLTITCPIHGDFTQRATEHLCGCGCKKCGVIISKKEDEIYEYLCNLLGKENVIHGDRTVIKPLEIDIYIPSLKIGIEYNGVVWHSMKFKKDKNYHLNKLNLCKENGIKLIQVFEDEYLNHKEIVLNKLKHLLRIDNDKERIFARKCNIEICDKKIAKNFLDKNHIQGHSSSTIDLCAKYNNKIIAVMSFKKERKNDNKWELVRFASDNNYICCGIGGKLFKYFIRNYEFDDIKSFADRRWTIDEENNIYVQLGFKFEYYTNPDYKYYTGNKNMEREHKFNFRKQILHKKYNLPLSMTESEMTEQLGFQKIYDCGLIKYVYRK